MLCLPLLRQRLIARLSTDPPASELYRACGFIIQYLLHDWVKSQNVEYGVAPTRQQLVRQALLFVPDGPSRGCREPPVFAFPW